MLLVRAGQQQDIVYRPECTEGDGVLWRIAELAAWPGFVLPDGVAGPVLVTSFGDLARIILEFYSSLECGEVLVQSCLKLYVRRKYGPR